MTSKVIRFVDVNGDEQTVPAKYEVCPVCKGEGATSSAVDGHGLSAADFEEWDRDDIQAYMDGEYDQPCEMCNGDRVVLVPDEERASTETLTAYYAHCQAEFEQRRNERYWGGLAERAVM